MMKEIWNNNALEKSIDLTILYMSSTNKIKSWMKSVITYKVKLMHLKIYKGNSITTKIRTARWHNKLTDLKGKLNKDVIN